MLGAVRGVGEGFATPLVLAHVGSLPRVGAQVSLEVLQSRVCLETAFILQGGGEGGRGKLETAIAGATIPLHGNLLIVDALSTYSIKCMV